MKTSLWNSTSSSERMKALNRFPSFNLNLRRSNHSTAHCNIELVTPKVKERTQYVTEKFTQVGCIVELALYLILKIWIETVFVKTCGYCAAVQHIQILSHQNSRALDSWCLNNKSSWHMENNVAKNHSWKDR